jgi:hypothetical protein
MQERDPKHTPDIPELPEGEQITPEMLAELSNGKGDNDDE